MAFDAERERTAPPTAGGGAPGARLHLDPVGGVAGDMFAAALLDLHPTLHDGLRAAVSRLRLPSSVEITLEAHRDERLTGSRFRVSPPAADETLEHVPLAAILERLDAAGLAPGVRDRARAIFALLAEAEGAVHGAAPEEVAFHEVGAWDSIADVVAAAFLIDALDGARWSCGPIPLGAGQVRSAHGLLPVPAPAAAHLLRGFVIRDDGIEGERVTPTGAAILRHLAPAQTPAREPETLVGVGAGFGGRAFPGFSNVLRVLEFAPAEGRAIRDSVAVLRFEIDDQTPEDLALGLDRLRARPGVLDVVQWPACGKKGRVLAEVQMLAEPDALERALAATFAETTTLGVRWAHMSRDVLARDTVRHADEAGAVRVKRAVRPTGVRTAKAEIDDLADADRTGRERRRRRAEAAALAEAGE